MPFSFRFTVTFIAVAFLLKSPAVAQTYRSWSDGPLRWDEFTVRPNSPLKQSEFRFQLGYEQLKRVEKGTTIIRMVAYARMNKETSWVHPDGKNDLALQAHQVTFDLVEYYRRRLQARLDSLPKPDYALDPILDAANKAIQRFMERSANGTDTTVIAEYQEMMKTRLAQLPADVALPFEIGRRGISLFGGLGGGVYSRTFNDGLQSFPLFQYGLEYIYRDHVVAMQIGFTGHTLGTDAMHNGNNLRGTELRGSTLSLTYGKLLREDKTLMLIPFSGLARQRISPRDDKHTAADGFKKSSTSVTAGIDAFYTMHTTWRAVPDPVFHGRDKSKIGVRGRFQVGLSDFGDGLNGGYMMMSLNFGFLSRPIRYFRTGSEK
jgi:hypothetical protein